MVTSWAVGAVINVVGSILINLGTNVMKLGHNKRAASTLKERLPVRKYREWQGGIGMFAIGNLLNFVSFAFAAQSLLAALGSVQFVSNVVFAYFVLHEKSNRRVMLATALIVIGCVVLVIFGNHSSKPLTDEQLKAYYRSRVYITYLVILMAVVVASWVVYHIGRRKLEHLGQAHLPRAWTKALPISYAMFAGMLGTQSVLFSKALSTLLRTTFNGNSQLDNWFFYLNLALFLASAAFWVTRLNKALKLFPAVVIVPTMQISWTLFSIVSGGIYYQEYMGYTAFKSGMFALGVALIFFGVYILSGRQHRAAPVMMANRDNAVHPLPGAVPDSPRAGGADGASSSSGVPEFENPAEALWEAIRELRHPKYDELLTPRGIGLQESQQPPAQVKRSLSCSDRDDKAPRAGTELPVWGRISSHRASEPGCRQPLVPGKAVLLPQESAELRQPMLQPAAGSPSPSHAAWCPDQQRHPWQQQQQQQPSGLDSDAAREEQQPQHQQSSCQQQPTAARLLLPLPGAAQDPALPRARPPFHLPPLSQLPRTAAPDRHIRRPAADAWTGGLPPEDRPAMAALAEAGSAGGNGGAEQPALSTQWQPPGAAATADYTV